MMLKYGSSNILWLCLTIQVPIANLAFALPFMPRSSPAQWESGLGLVLIMTGLITYRFWPLVSAKLQACGRGGGAGGKGNGGGDDDYLDREAELFPMMGEGGAGSDPRDSRNDY